MTFGRTLPLIAVFVAGLAIGKWGLASKPESMGESSPSRGESSPIRDEPRAVSALKPGGARRVGSEGLANLVGELANGSITSSYPLRFGQLSGLGVDELEGLLAAIAASDDEALGGDRRRAWLEDAVILRLTEINPEQAWLVLIQSRSGDTEESVDRRISEWTTKIFKRFAKEDVEVGMRLAASAGRHKRDAIEEMLNGAEGDNFLELVTWAESVDPEFAEFDEAVTWFTNEKSYSNYTPENRIFSRWAQSDPEAAKAYVLGLQGREERLQGLSGIAEGLAMTDPDGAVAFIKGLEKSEERGAAWYRAIGIMASERPADAARLFDQLPDGEAKTSSFNMLAGSWMRTDPAAATVWVESLPPGQIRQRAYKMAANVLEDTDPAAAMVFADQLTGVENRAATFQRIANVWIASDVVGALGWITAHDDPSLRADLIHRALPKYAEEDPWAAASLYEQLETAGSIENLAQMAREVADNMLKQDPDLALEWVEGLQDSEAREAALGRVLWDIGSDDPQRARALVESGVGAGSSVLDCVAQHLIMEDPAAGFEWSAEWLEDEQIWEATSRALSTITARSPEEGALQLVAAADYLEPGTWQRLDDEAKDVATAWGRHDLQAALAWSETLPDGDVRVGATGPLINQWVLSDPMAASQWIAAQPPGEIQQMGAAALSRAIRDEDPESAFLWSQGLSGGYRMELMRDSLGTWAQIDPGAARAAVGAAQVTDEERARMLRWLERD